MIDTGIPADRAHDKDSDGLTDEFEQILGTDPAKQDTDNDGIGDAAEYVAHTDPGHGPGPAAAAAASFRHTHRAAARTRTGTGSATSTNTGRTQPVPGRHRCGRAQRRHRSPAGTDPLRADVDGDGMTDGLEVKLGTDPLKGVTPSSNDGQLGVDPTATRMARKRRPQST